ncbi:MAG: type II toxin-antitoxin system RelE/ParE family toxin [Lacticaseibacillus songhuajiangensis]|jgi:mRNA interferase RelE/StbE|nr:type II toxin-antitoxin system RelE/ParE family toxin [Lacticaseibacillus songhuajiangensis]
MQGREFHWSIKNSAKKDFKRLGRPEQHRLIKWLNDKIEGSENPRALGKALRGNLHTYWRYRVGSFRIIADIKDETLMVLVVKVGKRGDVYHK